jgi:hypothetical protein
MTDVPPDAPIDGPGDELTFTGLRPSFSPGGRRLVIRRQ